MDDNLKNRFGMIVILTALGMVFISAAGFAQEKKNPLTEALFNRAEKNMVEGNFDAAIADYSKIIVLQPTAVDAYYGRGKAYFKKGDYERSIADHTKELELEPNRDLGRLERGNAMFKLNKVEEALKDYNRVIAFSGSQPGSYARGVAFLAKGDCAAAIAVARARD